MFTTDTPHRNEGVTRYLEVTHLIGLFALVTSWKESKTLEIVLKAKTEPDSLDGVLSSGTSIKGRDLVRM